MADRSKEVGTKRLHVEQAHWHGAEESFQVWRNWSSATARGGGLLGQLSAGKADGAQLGVKKDNGARSCVGHQAHRGGATDIKRLCVDHELLPQLSSTHAHFSTHRCCRCHPCNSNPTNCTALLPMAMRNVLGPPAREERTSNYQLGRTSSRYPGLTALLVLRCELEWHSWPPYPRQSLPCQSSACGGYVHKRGVCRRGGTKYNGA